VPKQYYGYSSGPIATGLAALDQHSTIYIIGFDMGPTTTKQFNNVYADTEFYRKSTAAPVYTGNWIKQMCQIAQDFSKTQFVRVQGATTAAIQEFETITSSQIGQLFGIKPRTSAQICYNWVKNGFLKIADVSNRGRKYKLSKQYEDLIKKYNGLKKMDKKIELKVS
jgi:hypothetical protein